MKRIVTLGGGTGTFVVLCALKSIPDIALTAIVTPADDGGSSGHLRDAYGFLPAGDARQALVALAEDEGILRDLFLYRFQKGNVAGHNLGNLFLTALSDLLGSEAAAIAEASRILRVRGRVLSASLTPATLLASLADGTELSGEHVIDARAAGRSPIVSVSYQEPVPLAPDAKAAIEEADLIVLGPGDLYTSTIATLLPSGTKEAIQAAPAKLVYLMNLFTKAGQTGGLSAQGHVALIERYAGRAPDRVLVHAGSFPDDVLARYAEEGECSVVDDLADQTTVRADLASIHPVPAVPGDPIPRSLVRHDSDKLKTHLLPLLA